MRISAARQCGWSAQWKCRAWQLELCKEGPCKSSPFASSCALWEIICCIMRDDSGAFMFYFNLRLIWPSWRRGPLCWASRVHNKNLLFSCLQTPNVAQDISFKNPKNGALIWSVQAAMNYQKIRKWNTVERCAWSQVARVMKIGTDDAQGNKSNKRGWHHLFVFKSKTLILFCFIIRVKKVRSSVTQLQTTKAGVVLDFWLEYRRLMSVKKWNIHSSNHKIQCPFN